MYVSHSNLRARREKYLDLVLNLFYDQGEGFTEISKRTNLPYSTIYRWIRKFEPEYQNESKMKNQEHQESKASIIGDYSAEYIKELESELVRAKSDLSREKLRADAYAEIIKVAEARFHIQIQKKAGARR